MLNARHVGALLVDALLKLLTKRPEMLVFSVLYRLLTAKADGMLDVLAFENEFVSSPVTLVLTVDEIFVETLFILLVRVLYRLLTAKADAAFDVLAFEYELTMMFVKFVVAVYATLLALDAMLLAV